MKKVNYPNLNDYDLSAYEELKGDVLYTINGGVTMSPEDQKNMADAAKNGDNETQKEILKKYETSETPTPTPPATTQTTTSTTPPVTNTTTNTNNPTTTPTTTVKPKQTTKPSTASEGSNNGGTTTPTNSGNNSTGGTNNYNGSTGNTGNNSQNNKPISEEERYYQAGLAHVEDYKNTALNSLAIKGNDVSVKGKSINGWYYNGDGTYTVIAESATLWDLYGPNWKELSGYEGDPTKLHVGDTVGKKKAGYKFEFSSGKSGLELLGEKLKKEALNNPIKIPESYLETETLKKEEVASLCLNVFNEVYKNTNPGTRIGGKLLTNQKSLHSTNSSLFGNLEKGIGEAGNASYLLSMTTSDFPELSNFSKTMGSASEAFGVVSAIIDFYQITKEPSFDNSRNLIASAWGMADPFGGMFLQSYYNYLDTVDKYFGNGNSRPNSLVSVNSIRK